MLSSDISPQSFTPSQRHQNGTQDPDLHLNIKFEHSPVVGVETVVVLPVSGEVVNDAKYMQNLNFTSTVRLLTQIYLNTTYR